MMFLNMKLNIYLKGSKQLVRQTAKQKSNTYNAMLYDGLCIKESLTAFLNITRSNIWCCKASIPLDKVYNEHI